MNSAEGEETLNRNLLNALAELAPKNNPELEALPVGNIAVGSTVVVIWMKPEYRFIIKNICADDTADLKCVGSNASINVSLCDLREARD